MKVSKFAIAAGITGSLLYLSCFLLMSILPEATLVKLANLLFHGMDFTNELRMNIPLSETILGTITSFFVWSFFGYVLAYLYNRLK